MATGPAACFGGGKVGCITVHMQDHVTGGVADSGVLVGGGVIQQPKEFVIGVLSGSGLMVGNGSKGEKHGRIHRNCIERKGTNNLLEKGDHLVGRMEDLYGFSAHWMVEPYTVFFQEWGESCGCDGIGCWKLWRAAGR